jgi:hypothetical protein
MLLVLVEELLVLLHDRILVLHEMLAIRWWVLKQNQVQRKSRVMRKSPKT